MRSSTIGARLAVGAKAFSMVVAPFLALAAFAPSANAALPTSCPAGEVPVYYKDGGSNTIAQYSGAYNNCWLPKVSPLANGKRSKSEFEAALSSCDGGYPSSYENPITWGSWNGIRNFKFCSCYERANTGTNAMTCTGKMWRSDTAEPSSCPSPGPGYPLSQTTYDDTNSACRPQKYFVATPKPDRKNQGKSCPKCGNPVNPANGNKFQEEVDYRGPGDFPLEFGRVYNATETDTAGFGRGWQAITEPTLSREVAGDVPVYVSGGLDNSTLQASRSAACTTGWNQIRTRAVGLAATTGSYSTVTNTCSLMENGQVRAVLPVYGESDATPISAPILAMRARRPDGREFRFGYSGGMLTAESNVPARLASNGSGFTLTDENDNVEEYDEQGRLVSITARNGAKHTYVREPGNMRTKITDSFGHTLIAYYDAQGRYTKLVDPAGKEYLYDYEAGVSGNLKSVTYPTDTAHPETHVRTYYYDDPTFPGLLAGIQDDSHPRFAKWTYDTMGRATSSEHSGGVDKVTLTYNSDGTTTATDVLRAGVFGASRTYHFASYNGYLQETQMTRSCSGCPAAQTSVTYYPSSGYVDTRTDLNGHKTKYTYDDRGLERSRIEAYQTVLARTIETDWHDTYHLPTQVREYDGAQLKRTTDYTYYPGTALVHTLTVTDPNLTSTETRTSATTTWTYSSVGTGNEVSRVHTIDGPQVGPQDTTTYEYDGVGRLALIRNALDQEVTLSQYDQHGNPGSIEDANDVVTLLTYDLRLRLETRTVAGKTTTFTYEDSGQLDRMTLPDGTFLNYDYDDAYRLIDISDQPGNHLHYTLDSLGNRTFEQRYKSANNPRYKQTQVFNALGQLKEVQDADSTKVFEYEYDLQGNRTKQTAADGPYETTYLPDELNRIWKVTDPAGVTEYKFNSLDQLEWVKDGKDKKTEYTVNALGDVTEQKSPDSGTTTYTYDGAGNRHTQVDARQVSVVYSYDALNRLTYVDYPGTAEDVTYTYDDPAQLYGKGRLTSVQDESGTTILIYDAWGNVVEERRGALITKYAYDDAQRLGEITYPTTQNRKVNYVRYQGEVTTVTTTVDTNTTTLASGVTHLPFGSVESYTLGNGAAVTRTFDQNYRVRRTQDGSSPQIQDTEFRYDLRGNLKEREDHLSAAPQIQLFGYDGLSRLASASASGPYGAQSFTYDAVGNRLTQNTAVYTYPWDNHRLESVSNGGPTLGYDLAGNVTSRDSLGLTYNAAGRPSVVTNSATATSVSNVFNAAGQRARKTADGATTLFHYDRQGNLLAETDNAGSAKREYVWLEGLPLYLDYLARRPETIVDNTDSPPAFGITGTWSPEVSKGGFYGVDYLNHAPSPQAGSVIVDDSQVTQTSFTGGWFPGVCDGVWNPSGCNANTIWFGLAATPGAFTWNVPLPWAGKYHVYALWVSHYSYSDAARYTITHAGGTSSVTVNQRVNGGQWRSIGMYQFAAGTAQISLQTAANGNVVADAIYVVPLTNSSGATILDTARWAPPAARRYEVYARLPGSSTPDNPTTSAAMYRIKHADGTTEVTRNQQTGTPWSYLGIFTFNDIASQGVTLLADPVRKVQADAVRFVPAGVDAFEHRGAYFHVDHLGTPQKLTAEVDKHVVWSAQYDPFGKATILVAEAEQPLRFPGQYFDAETGLHQNWHRDYDPSIGRYLQSDPIGLNGGINTYGYVGNNPSRYRDPTGRLALAAPALLGLGGAVIVCYATDVCQNLAKWFTSVYNESSGNDWPKECPAKDAPVVPATDDFDEWIYGPKDDPKINDDGSTKPGTWTSPDDFGSSDEAQDKLDPFKPATGRRPAHIPKGTDIQKGKTPGGEGPYHGGGGANETHIPGGLPPGSVGPWQPLPG